MVDLTRLILILPLFFTLKNCLLFMSAAAYIQVHCRLDFFLEANTMNTYQTVPDLGPYCLQYRLPKNITR